MKPAYWIGILALAGGILGYATAFVADWSGATIGVVVGALIGALASNMMSKRAT